MKYMKNKSSGDLKIFRTSWIFFNFDECSKKQQNEYHPFVFYSMV